MKKRLATPALVLVGILAFAACGDDDDGGTLLGGGSPTTVADRAPAAGTDTTKADASDDAADEPSSTDADAPVGDHDADSTVDTSFSGKGSGDFCSYAGKVQDDVDLDSVGAFQSDPAKVKRQFEQGRKSFEDAVDHAPAEIKGDVQTISEYVGKFGDLLASYDYDFTKMVADAEAHPEKFAEFEELTDAPEFEAASERFDAYLQNVCGIDTGSDTSDSSSG